MTERDVREQIIRAFEGIAERHGVARSKSHACALDLVAALTGHGIRLARPAHLHDPNADWRRRPGQNTGRPPAEADPDDPYYAARLYVTGNPPAGAAPPPEGAQLEIPID